MSTGVGVRGHQEQGQSSACRRALAFFMFSSTGEKQSRKTWPTIYWQKKSRKVTHGGPCLQARRCTDDCCTFLWCQCAQSYLGLRNEASELCHCRSCWFIIILLWCQTHQQRGFWDCSGHQGPSSGPMSPAVVEKSECYIKAMLHFALSVFLFTLNKAVGVYVPPRSAWQNLPWPFSGGIFQQRKPFSVLLKSNRGWVFLSFTTCEVFF